MKLNVKAKIILVFAAMGILLSASVGYATYSLNRARVGDSYSELAFNSARMAAALLHCCDMDGYLENGEDDSYRAALEQLRRLKQSFNLEYLYVLVPSLERTEVTYVFDVYNVEEYDPEMFAELGYTTDEVDVYDIIRANYTEGSSLNSAVVTNTEFGYLASAYVPVYNDAGDITAVVGVDISMDVIMGDVWEHTMQILQVTVGIIVLFLLVILFVIQRQMIRPIVRLSSHMKDFTADSHEELRAIEPLRTKDELQDMAESFNRMMNTLREYVVNLETVTADRERIATELNVATQIQASMLPRIFPPFPNRTEFDVYATMHPAKEVGGDFYDFFLVNDRTLAVVVADVSGKGVPAALFMVIAKTLIKNSAQHGMNPKQVFETVNNLLCENNESAMFVTAFMGYLDIIDGTFTFVNAGHNPPLLCGADGKYKFLDVSAGFIIAGMENMEYEQHTIKLKSGESLFMYTDGVTEAMNNDGELYLEERLLEAVNSYPNLPPHKFTLAIRDELNKFIDGAEQADDITMLTLKLT